MITPRPFDRVQYTLGYKGEPSITIKEIKNWGKDGKEYSRNNDYDGIFGKVSGDLEFVEDGKNFILYIKEAYGIEAQIFIKKEIRHPYTDEWVERYFGYLDLSTLNEFENGVTVRINSGGIEQTLKTRESEKIEIDRETTMDGLPLPELNTIDVTMEGRKIFLLSKLENSTPPNFSVDNDTRYIAPILNKTISSDERITSVYSNFLDDTYFVGWNPPSNTETLPQIQQFFYTDNDRTKYLNLVFDIDMRVQFNLLGVSNQFINVKIQKSRIGNDAGYPDPIQLYDLFTLNGNGGTGIQNLTYSNEGNPFVFQLQENECLALIWEIPRATNPNDRNFFEITKNDLVITENSFFEPTRCKMVLAHELGDRVSQIITNKDCFYSDILGNEAFGYEVDGKAEATGFAHGFWIRGFEKDNEDEENRFKPLTTSWQDFMEAMRVTLDLGVGIDLKGKRERLRMEPRKFFYQPHVTIKLPNIVRNIKRSVATEYYYSSIEAGYAKGGEYEESMGLDEYNGKSTFSTIITRVKNIFKIISPYRADSYGAEFARRKPKKYYPLQDSRYDQDIFQFDLKVQKYVWQDPAYRIRKWEDDFEQLPENVYSPETAYNLRYSPANLILRHGWEIASGLIKYPFDYIRYGSSNANSKLKTKLIGGVEISENSDIQNNTLEKAKFVPEWVEFDHECNFEVMEMIEGFSVISGKEIPNFYGLVEYRINADDTERGYLFNVRENENSWRILKSNR